MSLQTRIWITGAEGRLGSALVKHFEHNTDYEILTSDKDVPVEDDKQIIRFANLNHPDVIINCAAISDVDYCEKNPDEAYKINAIGARNVAVAARMINAKLIHISTDDVFNGVNEEAHNEFDTPKPISVYGKSKLAGESLVVDDKGTTLIKGSDRQELLYCNLDLNEIKKQTYLSLRRTSFYL